MHERVVFEARMQHLKGFEMQFEVEFEVEPINGRGGFGEELVGWYKLLEFDDEYRYDNLDRFLEPF